MPTPNLETLNDKLVKPSLNRDVFITGFVVAGEFDRHALAHIYRAVEIAQVVHGGVQRDDSAPFLDQHIFPVAQEVLLSDFALYLSTEHRCFLLIAALLHDAYEDGNSEDKGEILAYFGCKLHFTLQLLSRPPGAKTPWQKFEVLQMYLSRLAQSPEALLIKFADRTNNLECTDLRNPKARRYALETLVFYIPLAQQYPQIAGAFLDRMWEQVKRLLPEEDTYFLGTSDYLASLEKR
jgi:(p)ppGpp synthase/HD superfamily hydrolase